MKLKNFHRLAALGLAVGMTTALAACGNTAETAESTAETAESTEAASSEAADAATDETAADAEYAYLADFSFSDAFDENGYLKGVTATD